MPRVLAAMGGGGAGAVRRPSTSPTTPTPTPSWPIGYGQVLHRPVTLARGARPARPGGPRSGVLVVGAGSGYRGGGRGPAGARAWWRPSACRSSRRGRRATWPARCACWPWTARRASRRRQPFDAALVLAAGARAPAARRARARRPAAGSCTSPADGAARLVIAGREPAGRVDCVAGMRAPRARPHSAHVDASCRHHDRADPTGVTRIAAGLRNPANWLQLIKFGMVGGSGFVLNLVVYWVLLRMPACRTCWRPPGRFCVAVHEQLPLEPAVDVPAPGGAARTPGSRPHASSSSRRSRSPAARRCWRCSSRSPTSASSSRSSSP